MQPAEATYDGIALGEHARSGEASIRISDAEIASVHESAEACLGDTSAADAAYSTSQAYADGIANKTVHNGSIHGFNAHELEGEGEGRIKRLKEEIGSEPIVGIEDRVAFRFIKRSFDIVFSAAVLVCFSWLFALIAILIKIDDPKGPVFFKRTRVGKNGKTFQMIKIRSMCVDAEAKLAELKELNEKTGPVFKIADDPRITRVGKWLRQLSLDELPQFVNVLRSDMSVVGPRPALPNEVATYNDYQRQRLLVKPGMTCYWQTRRNRDSITFDEWVDLDLLYIKKCSAWSDFKLIVQTVGVVLTAQGS